MVAEKHLRLVPASYLDGASCLLPDQIGAGRGLRTPPSSVSTALLIGGVRRPRPTDDLLSDLTSAERLVVIHVAQGLSNKEIGSALNRAEPTIKHQVSSAMRKLGVQSRCQLIVRLLR